ncbi:hypothetical protein ACKKBF_B38390 [Auxenochlorella protothecoides x Auxenochlorella symbiontica]
MESAPLMLRGRAGEGSVRRGLSSTQGGIPPPSKTKPVILIDEEGHLSYTTLRKQALITDMALRHRDIRALEPQVALPYPPAILVRRQAIVLNLEGLKLIIGREKALVLSVPAPGDLTARCPADLANPLVQQLAAHIAMRAWPGSGDGAEGGLGASFSVATLEEIRGGATLPYELRALEGALLCLVRVLEREVGALERGVRPVLDRIRRGVLRSDLEELYESRTRLVRGLARVSRMKEILEELLDEEELMAGLCLTAADAARARAEEAEEAAGAAGAAGAGWQGGSPEAGRGGASAPSLARHYSGSAPAAPSALGPAWSGAAGSAGGGGGGGAWPAPPAAPPSEAPDPGEMEECEDLVEAYWLQVDALLSRLALLQERIAATEHLVNLDLDARRNQLVSLGLAIDLLLMAFECHMALTSIFGMNLTSGLEPLQPYSLWGIVALGAGAGALLTALVGRYARRNGLLFLPSFGLAGAEGGAGAPPLRPA